MIQSNWDDQRVERDDGQLARDEHEADHRPEDRLASRKDLLGQRVAGECAEEHVGCRHRARHDEGIGHPGADLGTIEQAGEN